MRNVIKEILVTIVISVIVSLCIVGAEHYIYTLFGIPVADFSTAIRYSMKGGFWAVYTTYTLGKLLNSKKKGND